MSDGVADSSSERVAETNRHSWLVGFFIRLVKEKPLGVAGGILTLLLLLTGVFADFMAPYGLNESLTGNFLAAPSARFWLGTDNLCRDVFSRVIHGARISMIVGLSAATIATIISLVIGIVSGYIGGKLDLIVQRVVDSVMCIPVLIIMLVVISITGSAVGGGVLQVMQLILVMGIVIGIRGSRIIRGAVIGIKENVYVASAKATGCSTIRILIRHILPNIMAPTIILFTIRVPNMILLEAALSFLGYGIPAPFPSWGTMLSGSGRRYMFEAPWMVTWPGLALASVVFGINMFGDAVRDILDPRMRGGGGQYGVRKLKKAKAKSEPVPQKGKQ